jgi:prepilin-type N-terminal cleavage/methylation domain-containing protein
MMSLRSSRSAEAGFSLVELMIVIALSGVLATAITSVVLTSIRTQAFTNDMRTVMDDGRISIDRIRKELRGARRVLESGSTESSIRFWLDQNQDGKMQADELICYATSELSTGRYEILRWSGAATDCSDPGADAHSIAKTLVSQSGVFSYEPDPVDDPLAPRTRLVTVSLELEVASGSGPDAIVVETTVRLRNVR